MKIFINISFKKNFEMKFLDEFYLNEILDEILFKRTRTLTHKPATGTRIKILCHVSLVTSVLMFALYDSVLG